MDYCTDCAFWKTNGGKQGFCKNERAKNSCRPLTDAHFGCVHFEEKQRVPFRVEQRSTFNSYGGYCWFVVSDSCTAPRGAFYKDDAEAWCDWLNDLWEKWGEMKPRDSGSALQTPHTGLLRIGSHEWRIHIHPEFSESDIEFRDGAGNTIVTIRNLR